MLRKKREIIAVKVPKPRNPAARALSDPLFKQRVVKNPDAYSRKPKHKVPIFDADPFAPSADESDD